MCGIAWKRITEIQNCAVEIMVEKAAALEAALDCDVCGALVRCIRDDDGKVLDIVGCEHQVVEVGD